MTSTDQFIIVKTKGKRMIYLLPTIVNFTNENTKLHGMK